MKMDREIKNHTPDEIMEQILANQELLLLVAHKFVTPQCAKSHDWVTLNCQLIDEWHRTRELTGEEYVGQFWTNPRVRV